MALLLSSWSFKLLMGFLFGSLVNLAVISKTAFLIVNSLLAKKVNGRVSLAKREFTLGNAVLEITAKMAKDPKRNPMRSLKDQEESSNTITYIINIKTLKGITNMSLFLCKIVSFFMQTPALYSFF